MKNLFKLPVLVVGLLFLLTGTAQKAAAQDDDISLQTFYDELSPYGTWIQDSQYGYVWRPDVDQSDFRPYYTDGRWVMTEYGNTWVSDYDWGWAPFHYGRWVNNRYNEWVWIPDTTWGPAWVSWRSGGGYYGWAPLGPGINININIGGGFHIPNSWWVFIPQRNIYYDRFPSYRGYGNVNIYNRTTIINYTAQRNRNTYFTGPRRDDIRRVTNRDVPVYRVNRTDRSGRSTISNNTVNIYNPRSGRGGDDRNAAPRNVSSENSNIGRANRGNNNDRNNQAGNNQGRANRDAVSNPGQQADRSSGRVNDQQRQQQDQGQQSQRQDQGRQQQQEAQRQQQSQRQEQARQQQSQRQQQQEARPQRQERVEQSAPPARSSEGRGNSQSQGGGRSERGSRN